MMVEQENEQEDNPGWMLVGCMTKAVLGFAIVFGAVRGCNYWIEQERIKARIESSPEVFQYMDKTRKSDTFVVREGYRDQTIRWYCGHYIEIPRGKYAPVRQFLDSVVLESKQSKTSLKIGLEAFNYSVYQSSRGTWKREYVDTYENLLYNRRFIPSYTDSIIQVLRNK
jgi:hypothetical protein